jgi:hypothetical protein
LRGAGAHAAIVGAVEAAATPVIRLEVGQGKQADGWPAGAAATMA